MLYGTFAMSILFFLMSIVFLVFKDKATILISGYYFISKLCLWIAFIIWIICIKQNLLIFNFNKYKVK